MPESAVLQQGTKVHNWTEQRPKSAGETVLFCKLEELGILSRRIDDVDVIAHPDDLFLLGKDTVQLVEYKTIDKTNVRMWKSSLAKHQLRIYCWVLEPILHRLGYKLAFHHYVIYLTRQGQFVKKVLVEKDSRCTEDMIRTVLDFWRTGEPVYPPMKWKCKDCPTNFRQRCRLCGGS